MEETIHTLSTGDAVVFNSALKSITVQFNAPRKVLSTSLLNGAYREDFTGVFNHNCGDDKTGHCDLRSATYYEHLRVLAAELGLDPDHATGMGTAAEMENAIIAVKSYRELTVTAIVTGGVEGNGGRAGDPATYYAPQEKLKSHKPGTINIILVIDADLPAGILARALVTCTEAKTAALQELMAGSRYSSGLATGSGTDQTIIVANPQSDLYFEGAGKHAKLGELIGLAVKEAVTKALAKQTGLSPEMQHSMLRRWQRFGITQESLWKDYSTMHEGERLTQDEFNERLHGLDKNAEFIVHSSLYIHLMDQVNWGLLSLAEIELAARRIVDNVAAAGSISFDAKAVGNLDDMALVWRRLIVDQIK